MKREHESNPDAWEKDALWELIRQSPRIEARPSFVSDVVRAARLQSATEPWWKRLRVPLAAGSLATAATAVGVAFFMLQPKPAPAPATMVAVTADEQPFAAIDDIVRTEALSVAAEHPSEFNDMELVSLIGF